MKNITTILIAIILSSCNSHEESLLHNGEEKKSLNGIWKFLASNEISKDEVITADYSNWNSLKVPGNWDTQEKYSEYVGKGYFQRNFTVPKAWQDKQIRLKFNAVYETTKVWLNGELLGEHIGGYTPFEFDITDKIRVDAPNSVVVMADNTYKRGAWWPWGGISRDVELLANEKLRIVYQHITAEPDFDLNKINFSIKYKVENNEDNPVTVKIQPKIEGVDIDSLTIQVLEKSTATSLMHFESKLSDFKLWHFDSPNLYKLTSELIADGKSNHIVTDKFGIRKFEVREEQFFLNNEAVRMNGVNRIHDHPDFGNTEPDELVINDMLDIKYNLGCNFARLMHAPLSENLLKVCDSIGFLVVEEINVWGEEDPNSKPNNPTTKKWMQDMVERDFNHPSVVAWSVGNELRTVEPEWGEQHLTEGQFQYVNEMLDFVGELDPSRLKTYVSNTAYQAGKIGMEPYEKVDFLCINIYGNAHTIVERVHDRFPQKPLFISEIGLEQIGGTPASKLSDELVGYLNDLKKYPYVTGVSIWSYNDYRSNYKGTPESGYREWGIVDEKRGKKAAYYQLKEIYEGWNATPKNN